MRFLITEEEKNKIRKLHNLQEDVLMEQSWLKKLIGTSADDLVKLFGDDAVKTFETLLSKSLQNSKTFVSRNGMNFLKSASGKEIPMKTIEDAIEAVSQGNIAASDIAKYLPQKLADGSEFRSVFLNSFSKKVPVKPVAPTKPVTSNIKQATPADYRKQVSQVNSRYGAGSN